MSKFRFFEEPTVSAVNKPKDIQTFEPKLGKRHYHIEVLQDMIVNGRSFVNTSTSIWWDYTIEEIGNQGKKVTVETTKYEINQTSEVNKAITDFGMLFNQPVSRLNLELAPGGTIKSVLNQSEIFKKWQSIKHTELASFHADEAMKGIFIAGDTEFSNTMTILMQNPLYIIFFENIYNTPLSSGRTSSRIIQLNSRIFQGNLIKLNNHQSLNTDDGTVKFKNSYISDDASDAILKDFYQTNYKSITGPNFNYDYKLLAYSEYSLKDGILLAASATCTERANDNLLHTTTYNIKLIQ